MNTTKQQGMHAEQAARKYLENHGLEIVTANYHCRFGELDLIMKDENNLIFVEVRYRKNAHFGSGAETVTASKQAKLVKAASAYLQQHAKLGKYPTRFDVISMSGNPDKYDINWIKDAFQAI